MRDLIGSAWELAGQSTVFLLAGVLGSRLLSRRPARAHCVIWLSVLAALLAPALTQGVRELEWGLLPGRAPAVNASPPRTRASDAPSRPPAKGLVAVPTLPQDAPPPTTVSASPPLTGGAISWDVVALMSWAALTSLLLMRLLLSLVQGLRMVARSETVDDETILDGAEAARMRLGVKATPVIRRSMQVACPVIWCWGHRPVLIVPEARQGSVDWPSVLTHELAHWIRRDHLAQLVGEIAVCCLPWNPLAWFARNRLGDLSELACDDWVIASGHHASRYAESLLRLAPHARSPLALAALTRRSGLVERIGRLLDDRRLSPSAGSAWTLLTVLLAAVAASLTAMAQTPAHGPRSGGKADTSPHSVSGTVIGPDGSPAAGASVYWIAYPRWNEQYSALPQAHREKARDRRTTALAHRETDAAGRFRLSATFDADAYPASSVVVQAQGAGILGQTALTSLGPTEVDGKVLTFRLRPVATIEGRLLTPAGTPAAGVTVTLEGISDWKNDELESEGVSVSNVEMNRSPASTFAFWPKPVTTDPDGRFRLEGTVPEMAFATLFLRHPEYADEEITVSTGSAVTDSLRSLRIEPLPRAFTRTLSPARPVVGIVTDVETGKPLAGVHIRVIPWAKTGGNVGISATTDAAGRYRVSGRFGDGYSACAYPDPGMGYLATELRTNTWPVGAEVLEMNLPVRKGRLIRGRVVDAGTGRPVPGVSVIYESTRDNRNRRNDDRFDSPVLADADGRFAVAALPGPGVVAVESLAADYIRIPLAGTKVDFEEQAFPHGFAKVDVPVGGDVPELAISLRKGVTLEARIVDPEGKPVDLAVIGCPELTAVGLHGGDMPGAAFGGKFRLEGADPDRTYRVVALHPKRRLGAAAALKYDPKGPGEIRLQPTARATGHVVDPEGRPIKDAQILTRMVLTDTRRALTDVDFYDDGPTTVYLMFTGEPLPAASPPEFTADHLIPGVRYYLSVAAEPGESFHEIPPLMTGEVRNLGKLVHNPKSLR